MPATSDVDVLVVREGPVRKVGKFRWGGVLLEVSELPWAEVADPEAVLGSYHLAGCFRADPVLADPTGRLAVVRERVGAGFADPEWVLRRCAQARRRVADGLRAWDPAAPLAQDVTGWLFPTGVTTHVLLVAGLRNPTVRRRYVAVREVLAEHGLPERYPELLGLLDGGGVSAGRVREHLAGLARTFDVAASVARTRFLFSADVTPVARPVVVDGSRELIEAGWHREAMFWIVATYARCHAILAADAPERGAALVPLFEAALADLGVASPADRRRRADEVLAYLPRLWSTARRIVGVR
ncbi:hypothetical protein [Micromonospora sp. WMMD812]|uniref:hypothetical protein n=1 Tax=Micromonospora sp. WMMD812 TaxID=3015152 RepID=UPI00248BA967|nr:hypothetical protein [Micromonospora sp. WMMD812]WBB68707.1 hypothetical protein O7603_04845 [Micromonospora sp. WMMD812]